MKTIFQIFLRDCRRLGKNVIALIVAMGLCIIPALYAWFNIAAMWDPYGSTAGIKIAVANEDKGFSGEPLKFPLNAGGEIVGRLKANDQLGWQFVDREDAVAGVQSGKYYAAIVIPADFSERLTSILTGKIENPKLTYYLNEKTNAIAPKMTDAGAGTVQQQVNSTFISTATEAVATALNTASGALRTDKTTVMNRLVDSLNSVSGDLALFSSTVDAFCNTADSVQALLETSRAAVPNIDQMASEGNQALDSAGDVLDSSRTAMNNITNTFGNVIDSSQGLYEKVSGTSNTVFGQIEGDAEGAAGKLDSIAASAQQVVDTNNGIITALQQINSGLSKPLDSISGLVGRLQDANSRQQSIIGHANEAAATLRSTKDLSAQTREEINGIIQQSTGDLASIRAAYRGSVQPQLDSLLGSLSGAGSSISGVLDGAQASLSNLGGVLDGAGKTMDAAKKALQNAKSTLDGTKDKVDAVVTQLNSVGQDEQLQKLIDILKTDPGIAGSFLSSPVQLETEKFYSVSNYGSAMAPFYSSLAIWVGGIVLVAIMKSHVDEDDRLRGLKPYQCYLGRYLLFVCMGLIQATIISLGDLYFLQIQCRFPLRFLLAAWCSSFVYINIIYALTVSFGDIGKALSVILLVIQIGGSGGTFPIEVTPPFFQAIYPLMPFTYSINAMRECVAGMYQNVYWKDLLMLLLYVPFSLLLGLVLRKPLIRLNHFFNRRLEETHLM